ncbi:quinone oxidoreductase family protein [Granulicella sibirica]|nr:zinc-binding dehydrogenase [Granulicella sibirica]
MKAAVYYENGGPEVFRVEDVPLPTCAPDGVLIKVSSISIEGGDQISRETVPPVNTPHIVGYQCAGEILEVGSEVRDRLVGQRVVCIVSWGSHAEYVAAPAAMTWPLPPSLNIDIASAVPVAFATANECLFTVGNLQKGQSVLIHGGSGALGLAAIQMAVHAGASVFTTSSDDAKLERLKSYGPVVTINNVRENFVEAIRAQTGGVGIDLVVDSIAGKTLPLSVATLKFGGRAIFVGVSGRDLEGFDPFALWPNCTSLHGVYMPRAFEADYVRNHAVVADCLDKVARGELKVDIDRVFSLSDVVPAYEYLQSRKGFGRVLLRP